MSTDQLDRVARDGFLSSMDVSVPPAFDAEGRKIMLSASDRMVRINRNAKVVAASDCLSVAVVRLLQEQGVQAEQHPMITDPASGAEQLKVLGLRITDSGRQLVAPIVPGAAVVRLYAATAERAVVPGEIVAELDVVEPADGKASKPHSWASAQAITAALRGFLASD